MSLNQPFLPLLVPIGAIAVAAPKRTPMIVPFSEDEFEAWWREYPRRVSKGHARLAYARALAKIDAGTLVLAVRRYAATCNGRDPNYICHPTTWLNGERWSDDEPIPGSGGDGHNGGSNGRAQQQRPPGRADAIFAAGAAAVAQYRAENGDD